MLLNFPKKRVPGERRKQTCLPERRHVCLAKVSGVSLGQVKRAKTIRKGKGGVFWGVAPGKLNTIHVPWSNSGL